MEETAIHTIELAGTLDVLVVAKVREPQADEAKTELLATFGHAPLGDDASAISHLGVEQPLPLAVEVEWVSSAKVRDGTRETHA